MPVLVVLAIAAAASQPWRFGRPDPWPVAVALGVFLPFGAAAKLPGQLHLDQVVQAHGRDVDVAKRGSRHCP